jgi:thiamine biosynthesis lipoprotein
MDSLLSPRRRLILQGLSAAALATGCGPPARASYQFGGPTMGSTYTVKIAGPRLGTAGQTAARRAVEDALADVVHRMSAYRDDSELSRFNRHEGQAPFALSADTFAVFRLAQQVSAATDGAFDITVAPVVDAWGFGPGRAQRVVNATELAVLERRVGWRMLTLDESNATVVKARADVRADLSGIAKGYAVDRAAKALDALGLVDYMVEAGGEIRTRGRNGDGRPWQIAIERPDAVPQRAHRIVPLTELAMATSGDYRIYFERDGARYCHEIEPATGLPIRHGLASVTVVAPDCVYADAMATALIVLGPEQGHALAVARNVAAHFIVREGDGGLREFGTPAFAALGGYLVAG